MKNKVTIKPKSKPDSIRSWIAWKLVDLAKLIRPGNEAATTYLMELTHESMLEEMLYGKSEIEFKVSKQKNKYEK